MPRPKTLSRKQSAGIANPRLALESLEDRSVPATFTVNTTLDTIDVVLGDGFARDASGNTSLRAAIMEANALAGADTIELPSGTYALTRSGSNENGAFVGDLDILQSLTITGAGQSTTAINGSGLDRVFHILGVFTVGGPTVTITGVTITGGQAPNVAGSSGNGGGGILNEFSTLNLDGVTIRNNRSGSGSFGGDGGGIYTVVGTTTIDNSTITQNTTGNGTIIGGDGGGVASLTSTTTIRDSVISNNRTGDGGSGTINAGDGGGISSASAEITRNGFLTVLRTTVSGNAVGTTQRGDGGGIITHDERFVLEDSMISGNTAWRGGGVFLSIARSSSLVDTTISGNTATAGGAGGLYVTTSFDQLISGTTISGTTISGNQAPNSGSFDGGGGIINQGEIESIINSTISGNTTNSVGGGIANYDNINRIVNTTIAGNTGSNGGGLFHMLFSNFTPVIGDLRNTILADNTATNTLNHDFVQLGTLTTAVNNLLETRSGHSIVNGTNGNKVGVDPRLASLGDNGGPTRTHSLLTGSPAINAGISTGAPSTDQRGLPRPSGGAVDIGAFEVQNTAPVATNDSYSTNEDTILTVSAPGVLGNDTDAEGNPLTAVLVSSTSNGSLIFNANGSFTYRPRFNFNGTDSFTYRARDGVNDSNIATVTITINAVNDAPRPTPVITRITTSEDVAVEGQLAAVDPEGDPFTFSSPPEFAPQNGTVTVNSNGTWTYTPNSNFFGTDVFGYRVTDDKGASDVGAVEITVTSVNDAPVAVNDTYSVDEDATLSISVSPVTRLRMVSEPGDFIGQGLTYDFNPTNATFSARQNFDNGVSLSVDPPALGEFWFLDFAAANEALLSAGIYLDAMRFPFQDPGHPGLNVSGNGRGSNTLTGQFTVFDVNFSGSTVTRFAAAFEQHSEGNTPALIGWVMFNSTFGAGGGVLANDTDVEGDLLLGATLVSGPSNGSLTFNGDGTFSYTPNANFNGTDSFTYRTNDGRADSNIATVTITVNAVNDAPVATNDSATTDEDNAVTIPVLTNDSDVDGDTLTVSSVTQGTNGSVTINSNGTVTYTPNANFNGSDSFTYTISDGNGGTATATVNVTVNAVNDAPVAVGDSATTDEDTAVTIAVLGNDTDVEGDALTPIMVSGPAHGSLTLNADGSFTYTPAANYNGSDSFTYKVTDGALESNTVTVSLTVTAVNDAPVAEDDLYTTTQGTPLAVAGPGVLVGDSDVDGDSLKAELVTGPAHGTLTLNADGSFVYTPTADYTGSDSFTYRAGDGSLGDLATVTIQVTPAPATEGKITGGGHLHNDAKFNISAKSQEVNGKLVFSGEFSFRDNKRDIDLQSTSITYLRVESDGSHATIRGTAKVNGTSGYTFTVYVSDHGESGRNDTFRIVITGPNGFAYDSSEFTDNDRLDGGNIQIHKKRKC